METDNAEAVVISIKVDDEKKDDRRNKIYERKAYVEIELESDFVEQLPRYSKTTALICGYAVRDTLKKHLGKEVKVQNYVTGHASKATVTLAYRAEKPSLIPTGEKFAKIIGAFDTELITACRESLEDGINEAFLDSLRSSGAEVARWMVALAEESAKEAIGYEERVLSLRNELIQASAASLNLVTRLTTVSNLDEYSSPELVLALAKKMSQTARLLEQRGRNLESIFSLEEVETLVEESSKDDGNPVNIDGVPRDGQGKSLS